jgi:phosphohistidine phosphatase
MKTLYLIRHAKSSWKESVEDFERGLNKRGKNDTSFMPKMIQKNCKRPDIIISSSAKRAKLTAQALQEQFDCNLQLTDTIYECTLGTLVQTIENLDDMYDTVYLVGHNPSLNALAHRFIPEFSQNIPTFGVFGIDFSIDKWSEASAKNARNVVFDFPKRYSR